MRKTALTILTALLIAGSAGQVASASEHHANKAYRASKWASEQFRNANNSFGGYSGAVRNNNDFDRRNTFN